MMNRSLRSLRRNLHEHKRVLATVLLSVFILACAPVLQVDEPSPPLAMDPGVLTGELENGFSFYLRSANGTPDNNRIEVRLLVKAGSLHENDDQRGYAHLVEHMAYRGTANYTAQDIESLLEREGLRWGVDVNATTHYGATVYRFSLHQSDAHLITRLFPLMVDWLESIQFDPADIEHEKRIVEAEWRERYAARNFVVDPVSASAYSDSRYASRAPVGDAQSVRAATEESLRQFWRSNYRADNASLIITGSKQPWLLEPEIRKVFSQLATGTDDVADVDAAPDGKSIQVFHQSTNAANTRRDLPGVLFMKNNRIAEFQSYTNSELKLSELSVNFISGVPALPDNALESESLNLSRQFQNQLLFNTYTHLLRNRLSKTARCNAVVLESSLLESRQTVEHAQLSLPEEDLAHCMAVLYNAVNTAMLTELTEEEFGEFRQLFFDIVQSKVSRYRNRNASELAADLVDGLVNGSLPLSVNSYQQILEKTVAEINRPVLNGLLADIPDTHSTVYSVAGNHADSLNAGEMIASINTDITSVKRPSSRLVYGSLSSDQHSITVPEIMPDTSLVTEVATNEGFYQWQLKNGATVILYPDDQFDHLALAAISTGGYAASEHVDPLAAKSLPEFLAANGVNGYASASLRGIRNNKQIHMQPFVEAFSHGISASGRVEDLPLLLTMLDGYFQDPMIIEPHSTEFIRKLNASSQQGRESIPDLVSVDTEAFSVADVVDLTISDFRRAQRKLYRSPADFRFVFVGSVSPAQLQIELQRLAYDQQSAHLRHDPVVVPDNYNLVRTSYGNNVSGISLFMACPGISESSAHQWQLLTDILSTRLRVSIREQHGLTYDLEIESFASRTPYQLISFSVAPEDALKASNLVTEVITRLAGSITEAELRNAVLRADRRELLVQGDYHETALNKAKDWLSVDGVLSAETRHPTVKELNEMAGCFTKENTTQIVVDKSESYITDVSPRVHDRLPRQNSGFQRDVR